MKSPIIRLITAAFFLQLLLLVSPSAASAGSPIVAARVVTETGAPFPNVYVRWTDSGDSGNPPGVWYNATGGDGWVYYWGNEGSWDSHDENWRTAISNQWIVPDNVGAGSWQANRSSENYSSYGRVRRASRYGGFTNHSSNFSCAQATHYFTAIPPAGSPAGTSVNTVTVNRGDYNGAYNEHYSNGRWIYHLRQNIVINRPTCSNSVPSDGSTHVCFYEKAGSWPYVGQFLSQHGDRRIGVPVTGSDTLIDYNWGYGNISNSGRSDNVVGNWRGTINFTDAYYTFHIASDDGGRLVLGGYNPLLDIYWDHGWYQVSSPKIRLSGNQNINFAYFESGGGAAVKFWWDREAVVQCNTTPWSAWSTPPAYSCATNNSTRTRTVKTPNTTNNTCNETLETEYRTVDTCYNAANGYYCSNGSCIKNCPADSDGAWSTPPANSCAVNNSSRTHYDYPATVAYNASCTAATSTQYRTVDTCDDTPGQYCSAGSCIKNCPADYHGPWSTPPANSCATNNSTRTFYDYPATVAHNATCNAAQSTEYRTVDTCTNASTGNFCSATTCTGRPGAPTVTAASCIVAGNNGSTSSISWTNPAVAVSWVDISPFSDFRATAIYHKSVSGTSTNLSGFNGYNSTGGTLTYNPYTTYYIRLYNGGHSPTATMTIDQCLSGVCTPNTLTASTEDDVTFTAYPTGGPAGGTYTYSWSGEGVSGATSKSVTTSYSTTGRRTPQVTIRSGSQTYTTPAGDPSCTVDINAVGPFLETTGGDVHSNKNISVPGGR